MVYRSGLDGFAPKTPKSEAVLVLIHSRVPASTETYTMRLETTHGFDKVWGTRFSSAWIIGFQLWMEMDAWRKKSENGFSVGRNAWTT